MNSKIENVKVLQFGDYPEFKPNLTPKQILEKGSFGGTYFRVIHSNVTNITYKNIKKKVLKEFPKEWFENIDVDKYVFNDKCDPSINKYKVKAGSSLKAWEDSGWITKIDPYGWFQWYCRFYNGRRSKDDDRQVMRWVNYASKEKGRWRRRLINMCIKKNKKYNDYSVSPVIRQGLQQWGYELTYKDFKDFKDLNENKK